MTERIWKWKNKPKTKPQKNKLPSQSYLQFHFEYDQETGVFSKDGKEVGWNDSKGYRVTQITSVTFLVHRLIWKYVTGEEPDIVDHINRDQRDNRWVNLRNVDRLQNVRNSKSREDSSGVSGVYYDHREEKWRVSIGCLNKLYYIGLYLHPLDAIQARIEAEEIFWGKSHVHTNLK